MAACATGCPKPERQVELERQVSRKINLTSFLLVLHIISDALLKAKFPLIITARSGRDPRTVPLLAALSDELGVAVTTLCPSAVCLPHSHPHFLGTPFAGKTYLLEEADVILVFDVDIPWIETQGSAPVAGARVFVIETDPLKSSIGHYHVDAEIICKVDPMTALEQIYEAIQVPHAKEYCSSISVVNRKVRLSAVLRVAGN